MAGSWFGSPGAPDGRSGRAGPVSGLLCSGLDPGTRQRPRAVRSRDLKSSCGHVIRLDIAGQAIGRRMDVMGDFVGWFNAERLVAAGTLGAVLVAVSDGWRRRIGDRKRHRRDLTAEVELRQSDGNRERLTLEDEHNRWAGIYEFHGSYRFPLRDVMFFVGAGGKYAEYPFRDLRLSANRFDRSVAVDHEHLRVMGGFDFTDDWESSVRFAVRFRDDEGDIWGCVGSGFPFRVSRRRWWSRTAWNPFPSSELAEWPQPPPPPPYKKTITIVPGDGDTTGQGLGESS